MMRLVATALLLIVVAGCTPQTPAQQAAASASTAADESSLACDHFRNIAGDISKGLLTPDEQRTKFKQVYDDASIATPAVQKGAQDLLAAATADDLTAEATAVTELGKACTAAGH